MSQKQIADQFSESIEILQIFNDSKNRIWLIGFNGKIAYLYNNHIYNQDNTPFLKKLKLNSLISNIIEDSFQNIWILESNSTLFKLNKQNNLRKYHIKIPKNLIRNNSFLLETKSKEVCLALTQTVDNLNKIFLSSLSKPNLYFQELTNLKDFEADQIEKINQHLSSSLKDLNSDIFNIHNTILKRNKSTGNLLFKTYNFNNKYWVTGLNKGAYIFNKANLDYPTVILKNHQTTRAFQDREKNVWVGTMSNGVILFPDYNTTSYSFENILDNDLYTVDVLNKHLFLGNSFGEIIVIKEQDLKFVKKINLSSDNFLDRARSGIIENNKLHFLSNDNYITIDSLTNVSRIVNKNDLKNDCETQKSFKGIYTDGKSSYIANAGGIFKIDINTKKTTLIYKTRTTAVIENKDTIWFGTTKGLHYLYQEKIQKPNLNNDFNTTIITNLYDFNKGIIIATNSKGIGFLRNGVLKNINKKSGLLSNSIKSIFIAPNKDLWISTNYGLNRVKVDQNFKPISIESYTISEGLNTNDVRNCFATDDFAYVATSKGLNIIDLKAPKDVYIAPTVHINEIILNNKIIALDNNQAFSSIYNNIQFNYSGISFKSIGNISFKYRLVGLEEEWIETKNNSVRYSNLPFGNYQFELKSVTKNSIESTDIYQYTFRIRRPFYHTWIFRIVILTFVIGGFIVAYKNRINKLKKERKINDKINNLRFKALNAQMNPHFINNLLTMIIDLISKGQKEKAVSYLFSFSNLVNLVLQSTKSNLISLEKELSILKYFIDLNAIKYQNELIFTINQDGLEADDLEAIKVPPMILQPIVENCLKHGFDNDHPNPTIELNIRIENDEFLICTITDNGKGFTSTESKSKDGGVSLSNIDERLMLMNDNSDSFITVSNLSDENPNLVGTKVELCIPLIYL